MSALTDAQAVLATAQATWDAAISTFLTAAQSATDSTVLGPAIVADTSIGEFIAALSAYSSAAWAAQASYRIASPSFQGHQTLDDIGAHVRGILGMTPLVTRLLEVPICTDPSITLAAIHSGD